MQRVDHDIFNHSTINDEDVDVAVNQHVSTVLDSPRRRRIGFSARPSEMYHQINGAACTNGIDYRLQYTDLVETDDEEGDNRVHSYYAEAPVNLAEETNSVVSEDAFDDSFHELEELWRRTWLVDSLQPPMV